MKFGDKSETLAFLSSRLKTATVLEQVAFTVGDWHRDPRGIITRILAQRWAIKPMIVRSSVSAEDTAAQSLAGRFASVQNVRNREQLRRAVDSVVLSYGDYCEDEEHILVQPMLENVAMSGVALSCEAGTGRPYIVINYSIGSDTTAVTAGRTNNLEVYYHFRDTEVLPPADLGVVVRLVQEVERITNCTAVDIEFAFSKDHEAPFLLQARPLAGGPKPGSDTAPQRASLTRAHQKLTELLGRHPLCQGRQSVLGVMPDWNPAEMIGVRPRPLALSLYRDLITNAVWAQQRCDYGYRDLRGVPLLVDILGLPYIDVRASFNSFVPDGISDELAACLVDYYISRLILDPSLHDKVEFEIVFSCYTFDLANRLQTLLGAGFSRSDCDILRKTLLELTLRIMDPASGPWYRDRAEINLLNRNRRNLASASISPIAHAYWLLEDCRLHGTRPFAGLARAGFVARQILDSLVALDVVDADDRNHFMMGLNTVTSQMQDDLNRIDRDTFLNRYGHLRPGTYDILSPRYDEAPDYYFGFSRDHRHAGAATQRRLEAVPADLDSGKRQRLTRLLQEHGFDVSPDTLLRFLSDAMRDRERSKFEFSKNLSEALAQFALWGSDLGFCRDDLSYADVRVIRQCYLSAEDPKAVLESSIEQGRRLHETTLRTVLPPLITQPDQVWGFHVPMATPTFITSRVAVGETLVDFGDRPMSGGIVMLPNADPGFDWIFARGIAGFVTAYGGTNSHMAIRASELNLPAIVGAGDRLFTQWSKAPVLKIDCANRMVEMLPAVSRHETHRSYAAG